MYWDKKPAADSAREEKENKDREKTVN